MKRSKNKKDCRQGHNSSTTNCENNSTFFGVKSYLHQFYEQVSLTDNLTGEENEDQEEETRYLIAPKKSRYMLKIWRFAIWLGLLLLLLGTLTLSFSYFYPRRKIIVDHKEEMEIIDRYAIDFNIKLDWGKMIGLGLFCTGGFILSITLLLLSLIGSSCLKDDEDENTPFKVTIPNTGNEADCSQDRVPATEKLTSIQPTRESIENKTEFDE